MVDVRPRVSFGNWGALREPPRMCRNPPWETMNEIMTTVGQGPPDPDCGVLKEHSHRGEWCIPLLRRQPQTTLNVTCYSQFRRLDVQDPGDTVAFSCQESLPGSQMAAFPPCPGQAGRTLQNNDICAGLLTAQPHTWAGGTGARSHSLWLRAREPAGQRPGAASTPRCTLPFSLQTSPPHCVSTSKQTGNTVCEQRLVATSG